MKKLVLLIFALDLLLSCSTHAQNPPSKEPQNEKPYILGVIDSIKSEVLSESRILNIYIPYGYSAEKANSYPVIYLLDGSSNEYFVNIVGLVHYFNFPWVNRVPRSIVVGIANVNRNRDLTFPPTDSNFYSEVGFKQSDFPVSGGSEKFISFIEKELQPYIEKKYSSNASKIIMGQSLGGLLATEILLKKPYLFNSYIIMSPSLWWNNESLLRQAPELLTANCNHKVKVYVGVGNEIDKMKNDVSSLFQILNSNKNIEAFYDYLPNENHMTMIHQSAYNAFKLLYPKN